MDLWTSGLVDVVIYGCMEFMTHGHIDVWTSASLDLWTSGSLHPWTYGHRDMWTPMARWTDRCMVLEIDGPTDVDVRTMGLLVFGHTAV